MPNNGSLHWTEDDDLLAQFVLGRLSAEERVQLEAHLLSCQRCRDTVKKEQELASGIRRYGREVVKARLKLQLAAKPDAYRRLVTWQRVLSAAAVVVIVAGIGFYNRWFTWGEQKSFPVSQEIQDSIKTLSSGEVSADDSRGGGVATAHQEALEESLRDHEILQEPGTHQVQIAKPPAEALGNKSELNEGTKATENMAAPSSGAGAISMKKGLGNGQVQTTLAQPEMREFWVEGVILREPQLAEKGYKALEKMSVPERNVPKSKGSSKLIRRQTTGEVALEQKETSISQRNIQLLPAARQKLQQEHEQAIQTYFQQSDGGTSIIMYLDTLFDEANLQTARIEEIQPDSIVIDLQSRRIGYKLPFNMIDSQKGIQKAKRR